MRISAMLLLLVFAGPPLAAVAQSTVVVESNQGTYLCPQCGKLHPISTSSSNGAISAYKPAVSDGESRVASRAVSPAPTVNGAGVSNVLDNLNAQRARQGLAALRYDPQLQAVAERRAQQMAATGQKNHPPGSFAPGTHEGVGWSSSYSPSGVSACYTSDSRMQYAGAAMAVGRDGVYFAVVYR